MQTLTLKDVLHYGRKAYEAKTLTAQSDHPVCVYEDPRTGCRCVVGSALTDETLTAIREAEAMGFRVWNLAQQDKVLTIADGEDVVRIEALQSAHDNWCHDHGEAEGEYEARFVKLLYR